LNVEQIKTEALHALEEIKAKDIEVLNVHHLTALCDYMIVASADSTRQTKALARNVETHLRECGADIAGVEGTGSGEWVLVDLGSVLVHIMQPAAREYYNLTELWGGTKSPPDPRPRHTR
jgi:ribosome-associated protein